jgi:two-component system sensor histidine kinase KdpD
MDPTTFDGPRARPEGRVARIEPHRETIRDLLNPPGARRQVAGYAVAVGANLAAILLLLPFRGGLSLHSIGFTFLIVAVVSGAVGGLGPGIMSSFIGFIFFNYLFIPPYDTFEIGEAEDVVALFVFLGLSLTISILLSRARDRAEAAEERERELLALQSLSSDLVGLGPGSETYATLLDRVIQLFGFRTGALFVQSGDGFRGLERLVVAGVDSEDIGPDWDPKAPEPAPARLPLNVGRQNVGLAVLRGDRPSLTAAESRILRSFCDQLALMLERDRLLRVATRSEVYRQGEGVRRSLLAAVSHDLRSPLAAIKASVTDLMDPAVERSEGDVREVLATIDGETDRLSRLITDLLDMSRIEAGGLTSRHDRLDLSEFLPNCAARVGRSGDRPRVEVRGPAHGPVVIADHVFLERVLANLLLNAFRASEQSEAEMVEIDSSTDDGHAIVRVVDHGPGIPQAAREQLFHPFFDLDERNPRLGRGLGLAISKGFIDLMAGRIWVEDTAGGGATLAFSLPTAGERP